MGKHIATTLLLFLNLAAAILPSHSCPYCATPTPPTEKIIPPPPPPPPPPVACPPPPPPPPPPVACPPPPPPKPTPTPCPPPPSTPNTPSGACPIDTLKLSACVDLLGGLVHAVIGQEATSACCPLLEGVADLDAALCLCTAIRAKVLNLSIVLPVALELLIDCGKHVPSDYQCPAY